jgi:hypothetical protein
MASKEGKLLFFALVAARANAASVSLMDADPRYSSQRPCATGCFYYGATSERSPDKLGREIDCGLSPIENECFCRPDLQAQADSFLSSCVNSRCDKKTVDIELARSIYNDYCTSNGYERAEVTGPANSGTQPIPATVTVTVVHTTVISSGERRYSDSVFIGLAAQVVALFV